MHRGGNRNQFLAHFVNLEPDYNEKHTFYVKYRHNGINDLCVIDMECLNDTANVDFRSSIKELQKIQELFTKQQLIAEIQPVMVPLILPQLSCPLDQKWNTNVGRHQCFM